ncbi:MAG: putative acyl-CoA ligase [Acidimicrobiales bacterium]|jgi:long-chain acyl-CoA synthetase|nr:putative acyl-CoA ligase [Acidimicrobiales bacterium]
MGQRLVSGGIEALAAEQSARVALVCEDQRVTYGELDAAVNRMAHAYQRAGVGPGDRVAVMAHNRPELFAAWNGAARLGALVVPVGYRSTADEVAYLVEDSGAAVLVHDCADVVDTASFSGSLRAVWSLDDPELERGPATPPTPDFVGATVATMNYTSGTSGRPKGIERAVPVPTSEYPGNAFMRFWGFDANDVHLLCGPAYHTAPGSYAQMHLMEGATVVIMTRFDADACLALIERERVTTTHMVPANFIRILAVDWSTYDRASIRKVLHAAAPCPVAVKRRIMDVFPPDSVWEYFGMSEGMGTVISPDEWLAHPGSVGRPFPGVDVVVLDDDGRPAEPGEIGLIYVSTVPGYPGFRYHNAPEKSDAAWRDGHYTVGDLGWLDGDGYLFIADRRTDLVISGGVNIYPAEVEQALAEHPDVVDTAVFGLPDEQMGQFVHAIVELRPGSPHDAGALVEWLRPRLAAFKLPRTIEFVDELPREPTGKVRKRELREARL